MKTRLSLLALSAIAMAACSSPSGSSSSSSAAERPAQPARYVYNAATSSYEWEQSNDRIVTGAYQP